MRLDEVGGIELQVHDVGWGPVVLVQTAALTAVELAPLAEHLIPFRVVPGRTDNAWPERAFGREIGRRWSCPRVPGWFYGGPVYETEAELAALDDLLARSRAGASGHLRAIIDEPHSADAREIVEYCTGMRVISLATVTEWSEPRISALDGHFLHGTWIFSTSGASAKARHLQARPAVSVAYVDGERFALFAHGRAVWMRPDDPAHDPTVQHWTRHYGSSPYALGPDVRVYRLEPAWMVGYREPVAPQESRRVRAAGASVTAGEAEFKTD